MKSGTVNTPPDPKSDLPAVPLEKGSDKCPDRRTIDRLFDEWLAGPPPQTDNLLLILRNRSN